MMAPRATYRIQLHPDFTLHDANRIVPYLARLGVSHVYLSPITQATDGSEHGYDVTDPTRVADALGGEPALRALADALHAHDMGILLDIVPNHMAASSENAWWADLLENGAASMHAMTFDTPLAAAGDGGRGDGEGAADNRVAARARLCLPVLGAPLDEVIAMGELRVTGRAGRPVLQYQEQWFPIPDALADAADRVRDCAGSGADSGTDSRTDSGTGSRSDALRALLHALPYELADWRVFSKVVCYRRFFDISGLVGVRVEDAAVFHRTHAGILRWLEHGWVDGLRIDHIDGLRDPAAYLERLAAATTEARGGQPCYTIVEKILAPDERIPDAWHTHGTTGYEFARVMSGFLVDGSGYRRMDDVRRRFTHETREFPAFVHDRKRFVLDTLFPAELADVAARIAALACTPPDNTRSAVRELTAALDVYRTYITERGVSDEDRLRILRASSRAQPLLRADDHQVLDAVCKVLLLDDHDELADARADVVDDRRAATLDAIARWQQLTAPAMAKGFEDTALYGWPTLLGMNDVGGEPGAALDVAAVHDFFAERAGSTPDALNTTSTHDTKRGADVRARLLVLAERPEEWATLVERWLPTLRKAEPTIAPRDILTLLQTLIGAWPFDADPDDGFTERILVYMQKAAREAKEETTWRDPNEDYEAALARCVEHVLTADRTAPLRVDLRAMVERTALHGALNSLTQTLLACTAPGVPDIYQGTEYWRLDLVDPDNRRDVDFDTRAHTAAGLAALLDAPSASGVRDLLHSWRDGRIKQFVRMAALACRARTPALGSGDYTPIPASGAAAAHVLAFRRRAGSSHVLTIATRWPAHLAEADALPIGSLWRDTSIHVGSDTGVRAGTIAWRSVFTDRRLNVVDGTVRLADALAELPFGLWASI